MTWLEKLKYLEIHIDLILHLKKDISIILKLKEAQMVSNYLHIKEAIIEEKHEGWCLAIFLRVFKRYNEGRSSNINELIKTLAINDKDGNDIQICVHQMKILGYFLYNEETREINLKEHIATMVSIKQTIPKPDKHQYQINKYITTIEYLKPFGSDADAILDRHDCLNDLHSYLNKNTDLEKHFKLNQMQRINRMYILYVLLLNCSGKSDFNEDVIHLISSHEVDKRPLVKHLKNGTGPVFDCGFLQKINNFTGEEKFQIILTDAFGSACKVNDLTRLSAKNTEGNGISRIDISELPKEFFTHITNSKIKSEALFFNQEVKSNLNLVEKLLSKGDQTFMEDALFEGKFLMFLEGPPGCGKTASAYQMAKATNRDLILVKWQTVRERWIGASEKNLKSILNGIDMVSKTAGRKPIVLFNEAETFLSRRVEVTQSADQGQNSMVSQLLEWMEQTSPFSIVMFTANNKEFLDPAFERRLFQISFDEPDRETRGQIWKYLGKKYHYELLDEDVSCLSDLNVSGAEMVKSFRKYRMHQLAFDIPGFDIDLFLKYSGQQKWLQPTRIGFCN